MLFPQSICSKIIFFAFYLFWGVAKTMPESIILFVKNNNNLQHYIFLFKWCLLSIFANSICKATTYMIYCSTSKWQKLGNMFVSLYEATVPHLWADLFAKKFPSYPTLDSVVIWGWWNKFWRCKRWYMQFVLL